MYQAQFISEAHDHPISRYYPSRQEAIRWLSVRLNLVATKGAISNLETTGEYTYVSNCGYTVYCFVEKQID